MTDIYFLCLGALAAILPGLSGMGSYRVKNNQHTETVGVFGHVGNRNLGDEAIIAAVIENIKERLPNANIYGFTLKPIDTTERHGIKAFPIRRLTHQTEGSSYQSDPLSPEDSPQIVKESLIQKIKLRLKGKARLYSFLVQARDAIVNLSEIQSEFKFLIQCYKNLKSVDLLLICGSQQLIDYVQGGGFGHPYTLFKWSLIAKILKKKVAYLSVGAGPIRSKSGKFFAKKALSYASYRSYRDEASLECIQQLKIPGRMRLCRDLAFSLKLNKSRIVAESEMSPRIVGINPVPFYDENSWIGGGRSAYDQLINKLSDFALWLIEDGYHIHLFPTQLNLDPPVIEDICRNMIKIIGPQVQDRLVIQSINSIDTLINAISKMEIVVATRYHGVVLPYVLHKPVLGIAYHQKTLDLMKQMMQSEYAMTISGLTLDDMKKRFSELKKHKKEAIERISLESEKWKIELEDQFDEVINLIR